MKGFLRERVKAENERGCMKLACWKKSSNKGTKRGRRRGYVLEDLAAHLSRTN